MANLPAPKTSSKLPTELEKFCEQDEWILQRIATMEQITKGPVLDESSKAKLTELWRPTLASIGEKRFDEALTQCALSSPFFPSINEIRRMAGLGGGSPTEEKAREELKWLVVRMRYHGRKMGGAWARRNKVTGMPEAVQSRKDCDEDLAPIPAPAMSETIVKTLLVLGWGELQAGLNMVWEHSALDTTRNPDEFERLHPHRQVQGEKIEKRWVDAWLRMGA